MSYGQKGKSETYFKKLTKHKRGLMIIIDIYPIC